MSVSCEVLNLKQHNKDIKPLTTKQLAFVSAYIATNGGNGTEAVLSAGYRCKSRNAYARL